MNTYTVKKGDTLWNIAIKYHTSITELKRLNKLSSNLIRVGQVLVVKKTVIDNIPAADIVAEAKKYLGTPYRWAGSTPSGFDCSGFLQYVFARRGISIPRTVASIWNATREVKNPSVGDIVFFTTYRSGPSHAGIYMGKEQFIHADATVGVTITNMNINYWKARFLGARAVTK